MKIIHQIFLAHPGTVEETYFEHLKFAARFSGTLFVAAVAALLHAFVPAICERSASERINKLHHRMNNRLAQEE